MDKHDLPEEGEMPPADAPGQSGRLHVTLAGKLYRDYRVVLIQAGPANGLDFCPALLAASARLFSGAPMYCDHGDGAGNRSVRDLVGVVTRAEYNPRTECVEGVCRLFPHARWLQELIEAANADGPEGASDALYPHFGLSADLWLYHTNGVVSQIERVNSVDIVANPAAGGRFVQVCPDEAEADTGGKENVSMQQQKVDPHTGIEGATGGAAVRVQNAQPPQSAPVRAVEEGGAATAAATPSEHELRGMYLELKLAQSRLPTALQDAARAQFQTVPAGASGMDRAGVDALVERLTQAWARAQEPAVVRNLGAAALAVQDPLDHITLALEKLLGAPQTEAHARAARLSGIREFYDLMTGDWERYGELRPERVSLANITTSTVTSIVANALNKVLTAQYNERAAWWKPIIAEYDFGSTNQVKWVSLGGFTDLSTVAEGAAYTEKDWSDAEETSDFAKHGNYVGLTLEMIDRDDVQAVRQIPRRLALAAQRTLAASVAAVFTANAGVGPTMADSYAVFDASHHGNLLTTALGAEAWQAVVQAMFKQTEANSAKRIGVRPRYCLVPIELEKTALTIFTSDVDPADNHFYRNVQRGSASVIVVPEFSDGTDWAAVSDPAEFECICVGYRYGRAPELFVADGEAMGSMFTNDEMRIKVRFIYTVGVADYRGLHKNNVSG